MGLTGVVTMLLATTLLWAGPASAAIRTPTGQGSVRCGAPGQAVITWTVTNYPEAPVAVAVTANMSGALTGPVSLVPNPIPPGADAFAEVFVDGTVSGTVTLQVTMTQPFEFSFGVQIALAGNCAPPPPPPPPPPPATDAPQVAAQQQVAAAAVDGALPTYVG